MLSPIYANRLSQFSKTCVTKLHCLRTWNGDKKNITKRPLPKTWLNLSFPHRILVSYTHVFIWIRNIGLAKTMRRLSLSFLKHSLIQVLNCRQLSNISLIWYTAQDECYKSTRLFFSRTVAPFLILYYMHIKSHCIWGRFFS